MRCNNDGNGTRWKVLALWHLKGGIIIHQQSDDNWYYSSLPIENTTDLTGWDAFFPDKYK